MSDLPATDAASVALAVTNFRRALAAQLDVAGIVALTRLQYSPYHVTYRGHELADILAFVDPKGQWLDQGSPPNHP